MAVTSFHRAQERRIAGLTFLGMQASDYEAPASDIMIEVWKELNALRLMISDQDLRIKELESRKSLWERICSWFRNKLWGN
jgi:hypothetical protein